MPLAVSVVAVRRRSAPGMGSSWRTHDRSTWNRCSTLRFVGLCSSCLERARAGEGSFVVKKGWRGPKVRRLGGVGAVIRRRACSPPARGTGQELHSRRPALMDVLPMKLDSAKSETPRAPLPAKCRDSLDMTALVRARQFLSSRMELHRRSTRLPRPSRVDNDSGNPRRLR